MSLTPEQVARRKLGIGASEVAAALGLSHWRSPLQLYEQKVNGAVSEDKIEYRIGHALEPVILDEYESKTGTKLERAPDTLVAMPMLCHLDAWVPGRLVVNAKTSRTKQGWGDPGSADVPVDYLLQEHAEMMIAGVAVAHIPVLFYGSQFEIYEIPFDAELGEMIKRGVAAFWRRVEARDPPPPTTLAEANLRWRVSQALKVELGQDAVSACRRLVQIKEQMGALEQEAAHCEALVKTQMGEAEIATAGGREIATWKTAKAAKALDSKRLKFEMPEVYAQYEIDRAAARRFLLKEMING
jgi:predicted phage-related endonuclease